MYIYIYAYMNDQLTPIWMVYFEYLILNARYYLLSYMKQWILLSFRIKYKNITSSLFFQMMEERTHLPVYQSHDHILQVIKNSPVTLIRGETGCGKTTQVRLCPSLKPKCLQNNCVHHEHLNVCTECKRSFPLKPTNIT